MVITRIWTMEDKKFNYNEIKEAIAASSPETVIYIGADSKTFSKGRGDKWCVYVTVVIIHYDGAHGAKIYKQIEEKKDYGNLRSRLMAEVEYATSTAYELLDVIGERPFQIHLDVNPDPRFKSNIVVKEATGWVLGLFGFPPILKPDAFSASHVADRDAVKQANKRKKRFRSGREREQNKISRKNAKW